MNINEISIGDKIKRIRTEKGITQKKLAEMAGIATITIQQYEANKYKPKLEQLKKIATALDVPLYELSDLNLEQLNIIELININEKEEKLLNFDNKERHHLLIYHYNKLDRIGRDCLMEIISNLIILNSKGQEEASKRVAELTEIKKYNLSSSKEN